PQSAAERKFDIDELMAIDPERALSGATPEIARLLEAAIDHREISVAEAIDLQAARGPDLLALIRTADRLRREAVGDEVTYVVNRNINFTNICFVGCKFCAFKRESEKAADAYFHSFDRLLEKANEAKRRGATEICLQGGLDPKMEGFFYRDLLLLLKGANPDIHLHAYSPMEVAYGKRKTRLSTADFLLMLRDAGLDSLPGTAAEILNDEVRDILSPRKLPVREWVENISTAHRLGIRSTCTMMYGHVEKPHHVAEHLALLREIQKETGGFTEFVSLSFIPWNTLLFQGGLVTDRPTDQDEMRMTAISRLMLNGFIPNIQVSWVKLGPRLASECLLAGGNDFGGTLMEENISTQAGATAGQNLDTEEIQRWIRRVGRVPVERTTLYGRVRPIH
ncbi:MAG: 5-amino-6-(D-ribitylamino)uracil--L-tyrosine 4-hydroxyphenyl transferase CofH, partial [Vicinamibacteria bacterium]